MGITGGVSGTLGGSTIARGQSAASTTTDTDGVGVASQAVQTPKGGYLGAATVRIYFSEFGPPSSEYHLPAFVGIDDPLSVGTFTEFNPFRLYVRVANFADQSGRTYPGSTQVLSAYDDFGQLLQYWDLQYDGTTGFLNGTFTDSHYPGTLTDAVKNFIFIDDPDLEEVIVYRMMEGATVVGALTSGEVRLQVRGEAKDGTRQQFLGFTIDVAATTMERE